MSRELGETDCELSHHESIKSRKLAEALVASFAGTLAVTALWAGPAMFIADYDDGKLNPFNHMHPVEWVEEGTEWLR